MVKRLFDIAVSGVGLLFAAPVIAVSALAIRLSSPGPLIYRARRAGQHGRPFTMYKLRTMHVAPPGAGSVITAGNDPRVFRVGALLRKSKLDELPQLLNVLRGDMSLVGPRPEDPKIVAEHYTSAYRETLTVRPGLTSPGSLYDYTHGERYLSAHDTEREYVEQLLAIKTAIELVYLQRANFAYDLAVIGRTLRIIAAVMMGRRDFPEPPEAPAARELVASWRDITPVSETDYVGSPDPARVC
jgi:lipopolysaccharide/colanic/teichoic acid biosynthesis glycosyltransferase